MNKVNLNKVKELRIYNNFTQKDCANYLDISTPSYNRKEQGKRKFTLEEAKKLADLFNVSIEKLFFNNKITN